MADHLTRRQNVALWLYYVPMAVLAMAWERLRYRKLWREVQAQTEKSAISLNDDSVLHQEIGSGIHAAHAGRLSQKGVSDILDEVKLETREQG